jgi:type I restriction enzyme S subunit
MIATEVKYKKTGNEWVPEIPEHWEILKAKNIGYFEGSTVDKKIVKHDKLVRIVNFLDIYNNETFEITEDVDFMKVSATEHQIKNLKVNVGDVVFTPSSEVREDIGKSAVIKYSADDLLFSYHVSRLKFTREIDINFKKYLFNNKPALKHFSKNCKGSTRKILNRIDFKNLPVYLPPIDEQIIIANFLDAKSNQITNFIQTKQRFIELLKEQRQSIITNAVTKGIDEKVKMKETGVNWMPVVPEHWEIRRLKYLVELYKHNKTQTNSNGYDFKLALENIDNWTGKYVESVSLDFEGEGRYFQEGDVLFGKLRPYLAKAFLPEKKGVCVSEILVFTPNSVIITNEFLFQRILTKGFIDIVNGSTFGAKMPRAGWDFIGNLRIAYPPTIEEQKQIVEHIKSETKTLDIAISKAEREIELIKEYREAMIAEAVTGKMKL